MGSGPRPRRGRRRQRGPASPPAAAELAEAAAPPIWRRGLMSAEDVAAPGARGGAPEKTAGGRGGDGDGDGAARAAAAVGGRYRPLPGAVENGYSKAPGEGPAGARRAITQRRGTALY